MQIQRSCTVVLVTAISALALLLAACADSTEEEPASPDVDLHGVWELREGTGHAGPIPSVETHPITLAVETDERRISGTAACNSYGGELVLEGERVEITELFATEMACSPQEVMEAERAYLSALVEVTSVSRDRNELTLTGRGVTLAFERRPEPEDAALVGTTFVLDTRVTGDTASTVPETDPPATLRLSEDGTFQAYTGCNTLDGDFAERGTQLELTLRSTTDAACGGEVGALEEHILTVLDGEVAWEIDGQRLALTAPDGSGLGYRAESPQRSVD